LVITFDTCQSGQRRHQFRMRVPQYRHRNASSKVHVLATLLIPQTRAKAARRDEIDRLVVGDHDVVERLSGDLRHGDLGGCGKSGNNS
jgi:hypothetical protein